MIMYDMYVWLSNVQKLVLSIMDIILQKKMKMSLLLLHEQKFKPICQNVPFLFNNITQYWWQCREMNIQLCWKSRCAKTF